MKYLTYSASYLLFAATTLRGCAAIAFKFAFQAFHRLGSWRPISYLVEATTISDLLKGMKASQRPAAW